MWVQAQLLKCFYYLLLKVWRWKDLFWWHKMMMNVEKNAFVKHWTHHPDASRELWWKVPNIVLITIESFTSNIVTNSGLTWNNSILPRTYLKMTVMQKINQFFPTFYNVGSCNTLFVFLSLRCWKPCNTFQGTFSTNFPLKLCLKEFHFIRSQKVLITKPEINLEYHSPTWQIFKGMLNHRGGHEPFEQKVTKILIVIDTWLLY